jgi:hypothetical protein
MINITLEEIKEKVTNQWDGTELSSAVIFLGSIECSFCESFRRSLESIEPELLDKNIKFYYYEIEERPPLFAPNALPSLVAFYKGVRVWEGIGHVEDPNLVKEALLYYVLGETNGESQ